VVPVGEDQRQHIEYAREAAAKFNNAFGQTFKEPEGIINKEVAVVPGVDGKKMSKSYKNTIPLFGSKDEVAKAVSVTDSSQIRRANALNMFMRSIRNFRDPEELDALYEANKGSYKVLKEALVEDIEKVISPMREKYNSLTEDDVKRVLKEGSDQAREYAQQK
jgi:tryptophanyl-tRNA synthetase